MDKEGIERVFLRLLNCETDDGLELLLKKFLVPILLGLEDKSLVVKINELLVHVNKRLVHRTEIKLPYHDLVQLVKRSDVSSFTMNMGVLYVKKAFERLGLKERLSNIDTMFSCLKNKTDFQCDVLLSVLLSTLSHLKIPNYPEKQVKLIPSVQDPDIADIIYKFSLKVVLFTYLAVENSENWKNQAGLAEGDISSILKHTKLSSEELELTKCSLINTVGCEIFRVPEPLVATLMVIATADTRCSVSDAAESKLKKLRNPANWEDDHAVTMMYSLFLGADKLSPQIRPLSHGGPAGSLRLKMKLLPVFSGSTRAANYFPLNIQVVFGGLFGEGTNRQLHLSAVQFVHKICDDGTEQTLKTIGAMLKQGLLKMVQAATNKDFKLCGRIYLALGKLSTRCPDLFSSDVNLLSLLFTMLEHENKELLDDLREGLFLMTGAYKRVLGSPDERTLEDLLLKYINKPDSTACTVALRFSNILHPTSHLPSRYLCLLSLGSSSPEVVDEARAGLEGSDSLPEFGSAVKYISARTKERLASSGLSYVIGSQKLAYIPEVYLEVLKFVRRCLEVTIPDTVLSDDERYKFLRHILLELPDDVIQEFKELTLSALVSAAPGQLHSAAMDNLLLMSAAIPERISVTFEWCRTYLGAPLAPLRVNTASLLGIAARQHGALVEQWADSLLTILNSKQSKYEDQHGALLALGYIAPACSKDKAKLLIERCLEFISSDFIEAVCTTIYNLECCISLESIIGAERLTKLHQNIITLLSGSKEAKVLIYLTSALGALHINDECLRLDQTINVILNTSRQSTVELHFSIGKTLALMSSGAESKVAIPAIFVNILETKSETETQTTKTLLQHIIREYVLGDIRDCQYQAASIWLLSLLKYSTDITSIRSYKADIQHALSILLSNKDIVTQEVASEALALLYNLADPQQKSQLIDILKFSLLNETVPHKHVGMETKIFSTEDLGKLPKSMGGGNLTTYKELCSLASDMNQPEMIYQFMHLSNHSAIWSDRVGAAFGVGSLIKSAGKELEPFLDKIIPRVYRYQYDPNLKVQQSMSNIWNTIVPKPRDTVDKFIKEILADIKGNIHHRLWRTRESCCAALADLIRTRAYDDIVLENIPELWGLVFKVMDDIKESVRVCASKTAETLSRVSVSVCNIDHGSRGARAISTILPVLLDSGITSNLVEVQTIAILTVMKLSENSGNLLNPHTHIIIPAFISASATIEPKVLGQVTTMMSGNDEDREKWEEARAQLAVMSPLVKVIDKCLRQVGKDQLSVLVPKLASLAKSSVGLTPRITLIHTVSLLAVNTQHTLTSHVGKLMGALFVVLSDRSVTVRNKCAATIAVLIRYAKPSTVDNVLEKLRSWYIEKDDDTRYLVSTVMFQVSNTATETLKSVSAAVVPLVLFGKHTLQEAEKEKWESVWIELGISDQACLLSYISEISHFCTTSLESTSWGNRKQSAQTLDTVGKVLGTSYPAEPLVSNITCLISSSTGRYWPGKEYILSALATCLVCSKRPVSDLGLAESEIVSIFIRECKKSNSDYITECMRYFGVFLTEVPTECWSEVWELCQTHLTPPKPEETEESETKKQETFTIHTKVQEASILLLGVAWQGCSDKSEHISQTTQFLASLFKICMWRLQSVLICALQKVLDTLDVSWADTQLHVSATEHPLTEVLRSVDDAKHLSVRGLALKLVYSILSKLKSVQTEKGIKTVRQNVLEEVLRHVRDQVSTESNQNLKAQGAEIVSLIEREFV